MPRTYKPSFKLHQHFPEIQPKKTVVLHPRYTPTDPPIDASKVGGHFFWPVREPWPKCPIDGYPMTSVLQLRRGDVPDLNFPDGANLFQLFWCPTQFHEECQYAPFPKVIWRSINMHTATTASADNYLHHQHDDYASYTNTPTSSRPQTPTTSQHTSALILPSTPTRRYSGGFYDQEHDNMIDNDRNRHEDDNQSNFTLEQSHSIATLNLSNDNKSVGERNESMGNADETKREDNVIVNGRGGEIVKSNINKNENTTPVIKEMLVNNSNNGGENSNVDNVSKGTSKQNGSDIQIGMPTNTTENNENKRAAGRNVKDQRRSSIESSVEPISVSISEEMLSVDKVPKLCDTYDEFTVPRICRIYPERVTEYPSAADLRRTTGVDIDAVNRWIKKNSEKDVDELDLDNQDNNYESSWSVSPSTKIGGYVCWITEPDYPTCPSCGKTMQHFLSIGSLGGYGGGGSKRWYPLNEYFQDATNGDGLCINGGGIYYLFICRSCEGWPIRCKSQR